MFGEAHDRMSKRIDLTGRVVLITGGSRGLGLIMAEEFGGRGARVAICGRDPVGVTRAEEHLRSKGIVTYAETTDVADRASAEAFVDATVDRFGGIDVVVNNAGVIQVGPIESVTNAKFHDVMAANFSSAVHVTMRAMPFLKERGSAARIVNITSIGGRAPLPHMLAYTSSKFAMLGFSEGLRAELGVRPISPRVVTVIPGMMRTGSFYNAEFSGDKSGEFGWFSVGASLPLVTIDARVAARRIVQATCDGRAFLRLGLSSYALDLLHRISPRLCVRAMSLAWRFLPQPSEDSDALKGRLVDSSLPGTWLLLLGDQAAAANNEMPPEKARASA